MIGVHVGPYDFIRRRTRLDDTAAHGLQSGAPSDGAVPVDIPVAVLTKRASLHGCPVRRAR